MRQISLLLARLSPRTMLLICLSLAGVATYIYSEEIKRREETAATAINRLKEESARTSQILVATREIKEGDLLSMDAVKLETVPAGQAPRGAVGDMNSVIGLKAKRSISIGDTIFNENVTAYAPPTGFEAKIPAGFRAVTFAVDNTSGVAGFVAPDSHVDIIAQVGVGADVKSCPILADVRIIAAGTSYRRVPGQDGAQSVSSVTVAVNPTDARKLIDSIAAGRLYLTLRNDGDHTPLAVRDVGSLFPRKMENAEIESLTRPDIVVQAPKLPPFPKLDETPVQAKLPLPANPHTVELWSGSKKDEFAVSAQ